MLIEAAWRGSEDAQMRNRGHRSVNQRKAQSRQYTGEIIAASQSGGARGIKINVVWEKKGIAVI